MAKQICVALHSCVDPIHSFVATTIIFLAQEINISTLNFTRRLLTGLFSNQGTHYQEAQHQTQNNNNNRQTELSAPIQWSRTNMHVHHTQVHDLIASIFVSK